MLNIKVSIFPVYALLTLEMLTPVTNGKHEFACRSYMITYKWMTVCCVDTMIATGHIIWQACNVILLTMAFSTNGSSFEGKKRSNHK